MNKADIIAKLKELGIEFDEAASKADLQALLPKDEEEADSDGIVVRDPMKLRPVELPLVITLPDSASNAQKAFARTLNGYAYKNPTKWAQKKDDRIETVDGKQVSVKGLITKLKELKNAPDPVEDPRLRINQQLPA